MSELVAYQRLARLSIHKKMEYSRPFRQLKGQLHMTTLLVEIDSSGTQLTQMEHIPTLQEESTVLLQIRTLLLET